MKKSDTIKLRDNILNGSKLAFRRLIENLKKEDGEIVVSHEGKIVRIKARDID